MTMLQPSRPEGGKNESPMDIWRELTGAEETQNSNSKLGQQGGVMANAMSLTTIGETAVCLRMCGVPRVCRR